MTANSCARLCTAHTEICISNCGVTSHNCSRKIVNSYDWKGISYPMNWWNKSIEYSIYHLLLLRGSGRGGSSLSREAQTSLSPATSSSSSGGTPRRSQANVSWVFPGVSSRWDVPGTPHQGGVQEAS